MQRFMSMKILAAIVLLSVIAAIATVILLRPTEAATSSTKPDARHEMLLPLKSPADSAASIAGSSRQATVSIDNFKFTPRELSVSVGDTVTWVNRDDVPHTATSKDDPASFDSKALDTDDKYSFTFTKPGTYSYYCKVHTHMTGSIIVK